MSDGTKKIIMSVIALALLISAVYAITGFFGEDEIVAKANMRTLMDLETGELFEFTVDEKLGAVSTQESQDGYGHVVSDRVVFRSRVRTGRRYPGDSKRVAGQEGRTHLLPEVRVAGAVPQSPAQKCGSGSAAGRIGRVFGKRITCRSSRAR
jgi:hypothetical protein